MEDGVKDPEKPKCFLTADKAGWIKKSSGGLLGFWKERYILLRKTQLLVCEDEDDQKCIETVELASYEKCQDLRALMKRKNRFILIRAPGCKVPDIKFQATNGEEKESWMKALNEGINRGKNSIFDEVKVDESLSLEHVTRGRAKVAQGRRLPTRTHLKEVANAMSDGILRCDLDVANNDPPHSILATSEAAKVSPRKEVLKPPMPPTKLLIPSVEKQSADSVPEDVEVRKPPVPPVKPLKETVGSNDLLNLVEEGDVADGGEAVEGSKGADHAENVNEVNKEMPKAPVPPPKIISDKMKVTWDGLANDGQGGAAVNPLAVGSNEDLHKVDKKVVKPPTPPPKILSDKLKAGMNSTLSKSDVDASKSGIQSDDSNPSVNGINDEGSTKPLSEEDGEQELQLEEEKETSLEQGGNQESLSLHLQDQTPVLEFVGNTSPTKPRSASLGDLLSDPKKKPLLGQDLQWGAALHVTQMEKKVAYEQERTKHLLQKVLGGGLEQAQESNGPLVNAETLLNEAVEQLRQATQVLQEIRDLGELKKEPAERRKATPKDLATLYRRSAP